MQEVKTMTQPQTVCQQSAMETGLSKGDDSLSSSSTAGMGDLNLLNVIAMSPDMSASASSNNLNSHRFSTPRTPSTAKRMTLNSPPDFNGNNGQSITTHQSLYSLVGGSCPSGQPFILSPHPNKPSSVATISSEYRPHRPASTPSNNANQDEDSDMQQNNQHTNQSPVPQTNGSGLGSSRFSFHRAHGAFSSRSISQTTNQNSNQSVSSPTNQEFMYKLSKAPNYSMALEMSCNGPLLMSPVSRSTTPLASQDLNQPPLSILHNGQGGRMASANFSAIQEPMGQPHFPRASAPGSTRSLPSPDLDQPSQTTSPRADGGPSKAYSTCSSNPSTPQGAGSVNGCPSPQVSDLSSEETDMSVSQEQQSFAQSYASLTPWTSKLTAPGYVPLPRPASDAMPIPLESISKEYMLAMSPTTLELPTQPPLMRGYQSYSSLQPGMAGLNNENVNGRAGKNGTLHPPKANFKVLPNKEHRFKRTADALQKSGLWEVAMKTGNLMKRNRELQRELEQFRTDALTFLKSVIKNPQNRHFIKNVLNNALSSNSSQCNGSSMMTVVVSAAAAAAAASVRLDSSGSTDESTSSNNST